ncbi:GlcG/HbpS family heme-binding protein [Pseudomonas borbori]
MSVLNLNTLSSNTLNLDTATRISSHVLSIGRELSASPLTVAVLDSGGHLISLQREDGASLLRPQIAIGKAWGALALGKGSRAIAADAQQRPAFIGAVNNLANGQLIPAPGGVLIRDGQGNVVGAVGITGDTSDIDEQCAVGALQALGMTADAGVAP